jgi:hypothetical protein
MDAKQYILEELNSLVTKFPSVRVRYGYDSNARVHCVEVVPKEVYYSNDEYISWENDVTSRFIEHFPAENIGFISDDAVVGIEHAEYALRGKDYASAEGKAKISAPAYRKPKARAMEYA